MPHEFKLKEKPNQRQLIVHTTDDKVISYLMDKSNWAKYGIICLINKKRSQRYVMTIDMRVNFQSVCSLMYDDLIILTDFEKWSK